MKTKDDQSLIEVWEMKEKVQIDFKKSSFDNFIDFVENDVKEIKKQFKIKNRKIITKPLTTV
jgi:hypothetical protein